MTALAEIQQIAKTKLEAMIIDHTVEAATEILKDSGLQLRVVKREGCPMITTRDYNPFRVNVGTDKGFINEVLGNG